MKRKPIIIILMLLFSCIHPDKKNCIDNNYFFQVKMNLYKKNHSDVVKINTGEMVKSIPYISCELQCKDRSLNKDSSVIKCLPYYNGDLCLFESDLLIGFRIDKLNNQLTNFYGNHFHGELSTPINLIESEIWSKEYKRILENNKDLLNECLLEAYEEIK